MFIPAEGTKGNNVRTTVHKSKFYSKLKTGTITKLEQKLQNIQNFYHNGYIRKEEMHSSMSLLVQAARKL